MTVGPRFLLLPDVADELNVSFSQVYALVRSGDLPAIKIGGRGQGRVERSQLEAWITRLHEETAEGIARGVITVEPAQETDEL